MFRSALSLVCAVLVAAGLLTVSASAAQSVTFDQVTAHGGEVPYQECRDFGFDWAASDDSGLAAEWEATATLYRPGGAEAASVENWGSGGDAGDASAFTICWDERAGTYEVAVAVTFYDAGQQVVDSAVGRDSMEITREREPGRAATRSFLRVSDRTPHFEERVVFTLRSQVRRDGAWRANRHASMVLAVRCATPRGDTGWVTMAAGEVNRRGIGSAVFIYDIPRSWRCRYVSATPRTEGAKASMSDRVRVRTGATASARPGLDRRSDAPAGTVLADGGGLVDLVR
jgi:hypothetical protein